VKLDQPYCRAVEECVKQILEDYRREVERLRESSPPPPPDPAEELLKEYPELERRGDAHCPCPPCRAKQPWETLR
jgi:hypothetical protein